MSSKGGVPPPGDGTTFYIPTGGASRKNTVKTP
jgi:hypothetical protein